MDSLYLAGIYQLNMQKCAVLWSTFFFNLKFWQHNSSSLTTHHSAAAHVWKTMQQTPKCVHRVRKLENRLRCYWKYVVVIDTAKIVTRFRYWELLQVMAKPRMINGLWEQRRLFVQGLFESLFFFCCITQVQIRSHFISLSKCSYISFLTDITPT